MNEKIKLYVDLKLQAKALEEQIKTIGDEIKDSVVGKINIDGNVLQKKTKITYSIKDDIDVRELAARYPDLVDIKINAKELYKIADDPDRIINENIVTYLEVKKGKEDMIDIDI